MSPPEAGLWEARTCDAGHDLLKTIRPEEVGLAFTNEDGLDEVARLARFAHEAEYGAWPVGDIRLPEDAPRPKLMFPPVDFAPDFLAVTSGRYLVSARLRYAMALPDACVQYRPIELLDGSDLAYQQDYRWMSYLAQEHVLDLERSNYAVRESIFERLKDQLHLDCIERFVVKDDFEPRCGLFRMHGMRSRLIATETLIRRVERAECTGMRFLDLSLSVKTHPEFVLRTPTRR